MVSQRLDRELWLAIPLFTMGAAISLELVTPSLAGFDLGQTLIEPAGVPVTVSRLMSVVALGIVVLNRDAGLSSLTDFIGIEAWAVYVTLGLVFAPPFLPVVQGTLVEQPWAILAFLMQTIGISIISYLN